MDGQIIWLPMGAPVLLVTLTLCFVVARLSARALSGGHDRSVPLQGSMAVFASSIALFGVLITCVFFITAYRVDAGVRLEVRHQANQLRSELQQQVDDFEQEYTYAGTWWHPFGALP